MVKIELDTRLPEICYGNDYPEQPIAIGVTPATETTGITLLGDLPDFGVDLLDLAEAVGATGAAGNLVKQPAVGSGLATVFFVGLGAMSADDLRQAGAGLARLADPEIATRIPALVPIAPAQAFIHGYFLASFSYDFKKETPKAKRLTLVGEVAKTEIAAAEIVAIAARKARLLATVPANIKNPKWLAEIAAEIDGVAVEIWDEKDLAKHGFGGLVAVGQASLTPAKLVQLSYRPKTARKAPHVVLVGKGITFDSGGLSIKPADAMMTMKRDMTGAGVVLSVLEAAAKLALPVKITGLLCLAENVISGNATRPSDVITHYGGRTTEITNTDAEGRLVLADGLAYASAKLKPDYLVDIATLTGAIKVALGQRIGGLFSNHDCLAEGLLAAGTRAGEPLWRMPLQAEYEEMLASPVADAVNASSSGYGGAITAALFLQHFVGNNIPWAHLDIASVGDAAANVGEYTAGPTGFGTRLLLDWLVNLEEK